MSKEGKEDILQTSSDAEGDEDEEPKVCQVCGDRATGYHFNAMTCEGCKGFFRRAMKRPAKFHCPFQNACVITKRNRRQCQSCRLQKCEGIGMLKELIMSDEAVAKRRKQVKSKQEETVLLTSQQEVAIQELLKVHARTFDANFTHFKQFRPIDRSVNPMFEYTQTLFEQPPGQKFLGTPSLSNSSLHSSSSSSSSSSSPSSSREEGKSTVFTTLPHIADLTTYMIQNIINFAKALTSFKNLAIEDQISLLKGATFEMVQIRFNMLFSEKTGIWVCGPLTYCMDDAVRAGFQRHLLDPLMKFHYTLRSLHLHDVEYVLMLAISLFSADRPGVKHRDVIDRQQEMFALTLKTYIDTKREEPEKQLMYPKILSCLTEMRTMNEEYAKQVLRIQDIQPDVSPLILEVISKDT